MIDEDIKKIIHKIEKVLKKDPRFKLNGDYKYKKQIKKIYTQNSFIGKSNMTSLIQPINMIIPQQKTKVITQYIDKCSSYSQNNKLGNLANLNKLSDTFDLDSLRKINELLQKTKKKIDKIKEDMTI